MCGAVLVGDGRRALSEESTRVLHEECAHVDGPRSGSVASWPRLAPPHVAPGHSEATGPPPPPKLFLALFLPLPLPPRALAGPLAFELTRGGPPRAVDNSCILPPPPPLLLLLPPLNVVPAGWRRRVLRTGPFWKSMMAFFSSLGS